MTTTTSSIADFIRKYRIRADVEWADHNPNMEDNDWSLTANHFLVTLRANRRKFVVPFSQGSGISEEPTARSVLDCLASDASSIENARTFEEWADEFGLDHDSRRAERTYEAVRKQTDGLRQFLGVEAFAELLWRTERE